MEQQQGQNIQEILQDGMKDMKRNIQFMSQIHIMLEVVMLLEIVRRKNMMNHNIQHYKK